MGIHEWAYDNDISEDDRQAMPVMDLGRALKDIKLELELGFDVEKACSEASRCLNCDMATVFTAQTCIECDSCVDICPTECITFTTDGTDADLRDRLKAPAPNLEQPLYVAGGLKTGRVMVKDDNLCLHCGLCSERCPTNAWDMQKVDWLVAHAGPAQSSRRPRPWSPRPSRGPRRNRPAMACSNYGSTAPALPR